MTRPLMVYARLRVEKEDGQFWVADWVSDEYGNMTIDRYHLSFNNKRDAERFIAAARRSKQAREQAPA